MLGLKIFVALEESRGSKTRKRDVDLLTTCAETESGRTARSRRLAAAGRLVLRWVAADTAEFLVDATSDAAANERELSSRAAMPRHVPREVFARVSMTRAALRTLGEIGDESAAYAVEVARRVTQTDLWNKCSYAQRIELEDEYVQLFAVEALGRMGLAAAHFLGADFSRMRCRLGSFGQTSRSLRVRNAALEALRKLHVEQPHAREYTDATDVANDKGQQLLQLSGGSVSALRHASNTRMSAVQPRRRQERRTRADLDMNWRAFGAWPRHCAR